MAVKSVAKMPSDVHEFKVGGLIKIARILSEMCANDGWFVRAVKILSAMCAKDDGLAVVVKILRFTPPAITAKFFSKVPNECIVGTLNGMEIGAAARILREIPSDQPSTLREILGAMPDAISTELRRAIEAPDEYFEFSPSSSSESSSSSSSSSESSSSSSSSSSHFPGYHNEQMVRFDRSLPPPSSSSEISYISSSSPDFEPDFKKTIINSKEGALSRRITAEQSFRRSGCLIPRSHRLRFFSEEKLATMMNEGE
jgi:hypothetical protein